MTEIVPLVFQFTIAVCIAALVRWIMNSHAHVDRLHARVMSEVTARVHRAGYSYDEHSIGMLLVMSVVVSILIGSIISVFAAVCAPILSGIGIFFFLAHQEKIRAQENRKVNDEICYFIGRLLRAGYSLDYALDHASTQYPQSFLLTSISRKCTAGASIEQAIRSVEADDVLSTPEKMLCATIVLAQGMGGNSARIFERIGDSYHQTYELVEDTASSLAQVKMSMYVIVSLPVVMLAFSFFLGSGSTEFLVTHPIGWTCLVVGISLELVGSLWMKKLVHHGVGIWTS